jgi:DNA polymerase-3 subunit gamma/tau
MNVIEIDAASNNGVDNIRQIREEVAYRPTEGKYKVYIIDEVHMLSAGAFNALLKTLEEPPAYVIFILATTEAHKIPITILSRCQRYDFHRISIDTIAERLDELMQAEQVEVEERALRYVAKAGDGSMRDALSLLDQCIAFHLGEKLTYEDVLEVLGAVDTEIFSRLLRQILDKDIVEAIRTVDVLVDEGRELGQLVSDFTWYLRNLLLIQSADDMEEVLDMSADNLAALKEEAGMVSPEVLMRYIRIFSELGSQIKYAANKRILLEIAIIRLCKPQMEQDYASLTERMDELEDRMESGVVAIASQSPGATQSPGSTMASASAPPKREKPQLARAIPDDIQQVIRNWKSIISETGGVSRQYLNKAVPTLGEGGALVLVFDDPNAYAYLNEDKAGGITMLGERINARIGKEVELVLRLDESGCRAGDTVPDLRELINFDIEDE